MRTIIVFFLLISFAVAAAAVSVDTPETTISDDEEETTGDRLQSVADAFVETFGESTKMSNDVGILLRSLQHEEPSEVLAALKNLAANDFSREQLDAYGALVRQVVPVILKSSLIQDNKVVNEAVENAIGLLKDKRYLLASNAVFEALGYVEPGSAQHELLKGVLESYRPLLKGGDLLKMLDTSVAMFNQKQSQDEAL